MDRSITYFGRLQQPLLLVGKTANKAGHFFFGFIKNLKLLLPAGINVRGSTFRKKSGEITDVLSRCWSALLSMCLSMPTTRWLPLVAWSLNWAEWRNNTFVLVKCTWWVDRRIQEDISFFGARYSKGLRLAATRWEAVRVGSQRCAMRWSTSSASFQSPPELGVTTSLPRRPIQLLTLLPLFRCPCAYPTGTKGGAEKSTSLTR